MAEQPVSMHGKWRSCELLQRGDSPGLETHTAELAPRPLCWSTAARSARHRQRRFTVQTFGPRLHSLVINHPGGVDIQQSFTGEPAAFVFLFHPYPQSS